MGLKKIKYRVSLTINSRQHVRPFTRLVDAQEFYDWAKSIPEFSDVHLHDWS